MLLLGGLYSFMLDLLYKMYVLLMYTHTGVLGLVQLELVQRQTSSPHVDVNKSSPEIATSYMCNCAASSLSMFSSFFYCFLPSNISVRDTE